MLNAIWLVLALGAILVAALSGESEVSAVIDAIFDSARSAVQLVIGLVGVMVFFLGLMRIAFDAGFRDVIARWLTPITRRLFPEIPADHPAMGAMVMNMASNILGLGNAATPFGLKAMVELNKLNRLPGVATDPMVLFLAINTSSVTLLPTGIIALRAAAGSNDPAGIVPTTLFATICPPAPPASAQHSLGNIDGEVLRAGIVATQRRHQGASTRAQIHKALHWMRLWRSSAALDEYFSNALL